MPPSPSRARDAVDRGSLRVHPALMGWLYPWTDRGAQRPAEQQTTMGTILIILLVILLLGGLPRWPHSRDWGYGPSGFLGVVLVVVLVLVLLGHIPRSF